MDAFEQARGLLSAVIAAYSARIAGAPPQEAAELREARARYLEQRRELTADDADSVREINERCPSLLNRLREEGLG